MRIRSLVQGSMKLAGWLDANILPGTRARRRATRAMERLRREVDARRDLERAVRDALVGASATYLERVRLERLHAVPVEQLRGFGADGVRWGALRAAGIQTLGDLHGRTAYDLMALEGIGEGSAWKIVEARRQLVEANDEDPVPPPRVGDRDKDALQTVRVARDMLIVRESIGTLGGELAVLTNRCRTRLGTVEQATGLLTFGEKKRAAISLANELVRDIESAEAGGVIARHRSALNAARNAIGGQVRISKLCRQYERRHADFVAVLDSVLSPAGMRMLSAGGLPRDIADRVEKQALHTGLLSATLRGYQRFGAKFMLAQRRTLLGDEMGLGKTVQALAVLAHLVEAGVGNRFLVVAPASVLVNWARETQRHTGLTCVVLHGLGRDQRYATWATGAGVGVTSFGTLRALTDQGRQSGPSWPDVHGVVVDEAHFVKNPEAKRTRAVKRVCAAAPYVMYLTGTPLENRLKEFAALLGQLQPPVARALASGASATDDLAIGRHAFQKTVAPAYLRRNQEDVLTELPDRIDNEDWVELLPDERSAYETSVFTRNIMGMRRAATIGAGPDRSAKLDRLEELLTECREAGGKALVYSYFLDVLTAVERRFETLGRIDGSVAPAMRQQICDSFTEHQGHAVLVGQITAAGVGLNLQAASLVVLLEPQWKPSTEDQAIARAHRMGQTRSVLVHRIFAKDSVDERMKEVLADKVELFDAFARDSLVKDASAEATEPSMVRRVIEAEVQRLEGGAGRGQCASDGA